MTPVPVFGSRARWLSERTDVLPSSSMGAERTHSVGEGEVDGFPTVVLGSPDGLQAAFAPGVGMACCSLEHAGEQLLGLRGGLRKYAETGSSMGIPLLYPWANRLSTHHYEQGGVAVDLDPASAPLRLDENGLPIHGVLTASPDWQRDRRLGRRAWGTSLRDPRLRRARAVPRRLSVPSHGRGRGGPQRAELDDHDDGRSDGRSSCPDCVRLAPLSPPPGRGARGLDRRAARQLARSARRARHTDGRE